MKVHLRHFNNSDCDFISQKLFPNTPHDEVIKMIKEWDSLQYKGSYFEMFAIEADSELVGEVSLYERVNDSINVGAILIPEYRYKGIAFKAITEALRRAKECGYKKTDARVLKDNKPSLRLCEKLELCIVGEDVTADGKEVYCLEKIL